MATYPYFCQECGAEKEIVQSISSYCSAPIRPECCNKTMERKMTMPMVSFDMPNWGGFKSPIDGEFIDSRAKQNEHMAKHGVVLFDDVAPDIARNKKRLQDAAAASTKQDVIEAVYRVEAGYKPNVESVENIIPAA